jgi:hypothetical protein
MKKTLRFKHITLDQFNTYFASTRPATSLRGTLRKLTK